MPAHQYSSSYEIVVLMIFHVNAKQHSKSFMMLLCRKSTRFEAFLPRPIVYTKVSRVSWIPMIKNKKTKALRPLNAAGDVRGSNNRSRKYERNRKPKRRMSSWRMMKDSQPNGDVHDVVKISTIVEEIRIRSKRNAELKKEAMENVENVDSKPVKRQKRSTNISVTPNLSATSNNNHYQQLAMFYRHPELTAEEQQKRNSENANNSSIKKQSRNESYLNQNSPQKSLYKPSLKECNYTGAASEVDDLNIPPPRPKYTKPENPFISNADFDKEFNPFASRETSESLRTNVNADLKKNNAIKETLKPKASPVKFTPKIGYISKNGSYVNLRDHQAQVKKIAPVEIKKNVPLPSFLGAVGYPADIPPYNPANIPYVDVPDYTDLREESLDEDDRRVSNEKYVFETDDKDTASDKSTALKIDDEFKIPSYEDVVGPHSPAVSDALPDKVRKLIGVTSEGLLPVGKVPRRSESLREGYKDVNFNLQTKPAQLQPNSYQGVVYQNPIQAKVKYNQPPELPQLRQNPNVVGNIFINPPALILPQAPAQVTEIVDEDDNRDKSKEAGIIRAQDVNNLRQKDKAKTPDFENFNINDYITFDFDSLYKKDDKKSDGQPSKHSSEDTLNGPSFPNDFSQYFKNPFENETLARQGNNSNDEIKIIKPEEFYFGDKDFFKPILEEKHKTSVDYYKEYKFPFHFYADDANSKSENNSTTNKPKNEGSQNSSSNEKNETYKPLPTTVQPNDSNSKQNNDAPKKLSNFDKLPSKNYHDFWSLEYSFSPKKINEELGDQKKNSTNN